MNAFVSLVGNLEGAAKLISMCIDSKRTTEDGSDLELKI